MKFFNSLLVANIFIIRGFCITLTIKLINFFINDFLIIMWISIYIAIVCLHIISPMQ